jgi:hypothetical protein
MTNREASAWGHWASLFLGDMIQRSEWQKAVVGMKQEVKYTNEK